VRNQITAAVDRAYYPSLDHDVENPNGISTRQLVDHISQTHAIIFQPNIDADKIIFEKGIEAGQPLAVYIEKQEICQKFSIRAGLPITDTEMHMTGKKRPYSAVPTSRTIGNLGTVFPTRHGKPGKPIGRQHGQKWKQ